MTQTTPRTAGIDTAKAKLDVAIGGQSNPFTVENRPEGWCRLAAALAEAGVERVGIEATGGYERGVVEHLRQAGYTVLVLQPLQVKAFARLHLRRAKNDRLDAELIAACAALIEPPAIGPDARLPALTDRLTFIEQLEDDIARWKTRLEHIREARLRELALAEIGHLETLRDSELKASRAAVRQEPDLAQRLTLVESIAGIGPRTALTLILRMPELGRLSREQAVALAGLAPFDDDTGQHSGERHIAGGRARVRTALFRASLPAAFHWNPALIAFYRRLRANGKAHTEALIACARKLLIYANTVLARGTPWVAQMVAQADIAPPAAA
jgi:transposase